MPKGRFSRRAFFKNTGMTALAGAVGARVFASEPTALLPTREPFDLDTIYDRRGTHSKKWDEQFRRFGRENIEVGMGIADMDFRAAPAVTRALAERFRHENWGYGKRSDELIDAIMAWDRKRYGLEIGPKSIGLSSGVHASLIGALRAFATPGSKVLVTPPAYNTFYTDIGIVRAVAVECPLKVEKGRYALDWPDLETRLGEGIRVFILCNPHNPTGNCWSKDDLVRLGKLCLDKRVVVLSDEIHRDFVSRGHTFTPFASLPDRKVVDNSVTFTSANKSFNISALRTGWFFSTNREYFERVRAAHRDDTNPLGVAASIAALTEGEAWLDQVVAYLDGNLDHVARRIREMPLIRSTKPEATYLTWIDASELAERIGADALAAERTRAQDASAPPVTPAMVLESWFVENAKVHLNPGSKYSTGGETHLRMNVATPRKLIDRALDNMAEALAKV